jgi:hypothetical protein
VRMSHRMVVVSLMTAASITPLAVLAGAKVVPIDFARLWGTLYRHEAGADVQLARQRHPGPGQEAAGRVAWWNRIAVDASGVDHTPVGPGETRRFGEQIGPGRSSRAMAIVHIAIFEAANAVAGGYRSYTGLPRALGGTSMDAAVSQAAHDTLVAMFPSQAPRFDALLAEDLATIRDGGAKSLGIELGRAAAASILQARRGDGSEHPEPRLGVDYVTSDHSGKWRQDPIGRQPVALGARWGEVRPFVMESPAQFRVPPMPAMDSAEYADAYDEVKRLGGDGVVTPTERTEDQTVAGFYWAYDGTPSLCAPPRLYNQVAMTIAEKQGTTKRAIELARLLALVHVGMADSGIAIWESKYYYKCWRPVHGIREADPGTGPGALGDGNDITVGDPTFVPLGAPASNLDGPNFTPPFPAYPGGHAGFGGTLFQTLRHVYGTDNIQFTFLSDEYNGITRGNDGRVRPAAPRTFRTLSEAEEENGQSRTYLGIHWRFDKTEGITQGRRVADWVYAHAFQPVSGR